MRGAELWALATRHRRLPGRLEAGTLMQNHQLACDAYRCRPWRAVSAVTSWPTPSNSSDSRIGTANRRPDRTAACSSIALAARGALVLVLLASSRYADARANG